MITCLKLTIETLSDRCANGVVRSGIFIVNFEHISHLDLVFLLLTLSTEMPTRIVLISGVKQFYGNIMN